MKSVLPFVTVLLVGSLCAGCITGSNVTVNKDPQAPTTLVASGASLADVVRKIEKAADFDIELDLQFNKFRSITLQLARRDTWEQTLQDLANLYGLHLTKLGEKEYRLSD